MKNSATKYTWSLFVAWESLSIFASARLATVKFISLWAV
jgi:hypothetical protein